MSYGTLGPKVGELVKRGIGQKAARIVAAACVAVMVMACANVKPFEREILADPIMDPGQGFAKQTLEQKFFSTREGSMGGGSGVGGGCGCSK